MTRPQLIKTFVVTYRNGETQTLDAVYYDEKGTLVVFWDDNG